MVRETSPPLMPENYPFSDYANKKILSYHEEALNSVRRFTFTQYCKYNLRRKGGIFSFAETDPLKYKKTPISSSLTYLPDRCNETAIEIFECLLKAGGEIQTRYNYLY